MHKITLVLVVLSLLLGTLFLWYGTHLSAGTPKAPTDQTTSGEKTNTPPTVVWNFVSEPADAVPHTKVTATYNGVTHDVGTYDGSCSLIDIASLEANEYTGVLCWWAGSGDEIGLFKDQGKYLIQHGQQQEPDGESQGFRGNFTTLLTVQ